MRDWLETVGVTLLCLSIAGCKCEHAINYQGTSITVDGVSVPISKDSTGGLIKVGKVAVEPKVLREASEAVQSLDDWDFHTCQQGKQLPEMDREKFFEFRAKQETQARVALQAMAKAQTPEEFKQALDLLNETNVAARQSLLNFRQAGD